MVTCCQERVFLVIRKVHIVVSDAPVRRPVGVDRQEAKA